MTRSGYGHAYELCTAGGAVREFTQSSCFTSNRGAQRNHFLRTYIPNDETSVARLISVYFSVRYAETLQKPLA